MPECSVIQGSKISGILFTIYVNEVPELHRVLEDTELMNSMVGEDKMDTSEVEHFTVNYVDDSNSVINFKYADQVEEYVNKFFMVLTSFYNLSKLKLNENKTALLIASQPKHKEGYRNVVIKTKEEEDDVEQKSQVKILGFLTNNRNNNDSQISKLVSEISNMMMIANKNRRYMNDKARAAFVNSHIMSRLQYNMPLIACETDSQRKRIIKIIHQAARFIRNDYCYKQSIRSIMNSINWKMPDDIIDESSAKFMHKVMMSQKPMDIHEQIRLPRSRSCVDPTLKYKCKSARLEKTVITAALENFNRLPIYTRELPPIKMKKELKKMRLLPKKPK